MTPAQERTKDFMTLTPMDLTILEEQSREHLYLARKTRWEYRRELQAALRDHERESRKSEPVLKPQPLPPLNGAQAAAAVLAGVALAVGGMALFFLTLWVITGGPFR